MRYRHLLWFGSAVDRGVLLVALLTGLALVATGGRYGFHRDELYFVLLGSRPSFGFVDQPPLVPVLANLTFELVNGHLVLFRVVPAAVTAGTVLLSGTLARQLGSGRWGQRLTAVLVAAAPPTLGSGHLFSTTVFDLFLSTAVLVSVVAALRRSDASWLVTGGLVGLGVQTKFLMAPFGLAVLTGLLVAGPARRLLRDRWAWAGAALAALVASPTLVWQAMHDWPQLTMADAVASGSSGTSASRIEFVLTQPVLFGPVGGVVGLVGLAALATGKVRDFRWAGLAFLILFSTYFCAGGKPYYLASMWPLLLAAGTAQLEAGWAERSALKRRFSATVLAVTSIPSLVCFLPVVPLSALASTPVIDVNYDAGETVGWPRFAQTVDEAERTTRSLMSPHQGASIPVLAANYGEAGALHVYADRLRVFSPHNSLWPSGPPPASVKAVVSVGYSVESMSEYFAEVSQVDAIEPVADIENDEAGALVLLCSRPKATWTTIWAALRRVS